MHDSYREIDKVAQAPDAVRTDEAEHYCRVLMKRDPGKVYVCWVIMCQYWHVLVPGHRHSDINLTLDQAPSPQMAARVAYDIITNHPANQPTEG
jgi:hypothetical protein